MNLLRESLQPVSHGLAMGLIALIFGALWAAYMASHHERLHGAFESQEARNNQDEIEFQTTGMDKTELILEAHASTGESVDGHSHHDATDHSRSGKQHTHSGSLAGDAMQRLLRGHIHFMGIGLLTIIALLIVASTALRTVWKKAFGWSLGLGALLYPPAWILMGFRTVELGLESAEESVLWLFGPAAGMIIGSLIALILVLTIEFLHLRRHFGFMWLFHK